MPKLEIIQAGLMTSIQDMGRQGLAYYAIPRSGVMDAAAARNALEWLHLSEDTPLIECTSIAPHLLFHASTTIALTGADFNWMIDGQPAPLNTPLSIKKGNILTGQSAQNGLRGYLALHGRLELPTIYGSYSTYVPAQLGGFQGRYLQKGDLLHWKPEKQAIPSSPEPYHIDATPAIPICKGPEFEVLLDSSIMDLIQAPYRLSPDSNRMGIRLIGPKLSVLEDRLKHSVPVLPGFIQLPQNGLPIILLQDAQTTGGYPRIAYVPERYFPRLNQIPLGGEIRFEWMR